MKSSKYKKYIEEIKTRYGAGENSSEIAEYLIKTYGIKTKSESLSRYVRRITENPDAVPTDKKGSEKREWEEKKDSAIFRGITRTPIHTEKQAIEFGEVDLERWEVDHWVLNTWGMTNGEGEYYTNYQVKLFLNKRRKKIEEYYQDLTEYIASSTSPIIFENHELLGSEYQMDAIWGVSDFHLGLNNEGNGVDHLCRRLNLMADVINQTGRNRNHFFLGGDFLESGAGTFMHSSQVFESIVELTGVSGIRAFYELFRIHFLELLKVPITSIYLVAGNHDRTSKDSKNASPFGSMAEVLYHFLNDNLPDEIDIRYGFDVVQKTINGVDYILTHGDNHAAKNLSIMIHDHGDLNADYHCLITAHFHSRVTEKVMKRKSVVYEKQIVITEENLKFRKIQLPPFCFANGYANKLGKSSGCGFAQIERSTIAQNINHHDYAVL